MSSFFTQIWLPQPITPEQFQRIEALLQELPFEAKGSQRDASRFLTTHPTLRRLIDVMIERAGSTQLRDALVAYRAEFEAIAPQYHSRSWYAHLDSETAPPLLDEDGQWAIPTYWAAIHAGYNVAGNLFDVLNENRPDSRIDLFTGVIKHIGWLPLGDIAIVSMKHDHTKWGRLAKSIMEITGGLLHPNIRLAGSPECLEELRLLADKGQFPGKIYAILPTHTPENDSPNIRPSWHFVDVEFLSAWLKQRNFTLE